MKSILTLLFVSLLAAPGALWAQETAAPAPAPAPTAAPGAPAAPAPAAAPAAPVAATPPKILYEEVDIVVDGKAEYAGTIQFSVEPNGRPEKLATVNILAKEKEKKIAEQIQREVSVALGTDYKVKLKGNEVRISKANKKAPNVAIVVKTLQLSGVSVRVEKG